jgi:DNA-directed RNA polymerase sigma subunit (sigma70/sigma32)
MALRGLLTPRQKHVIEQRYGEGGVRCLYEIAAEMGFRSHESVRVIERAALLRLGVPP